MRRPEQAFQIAAVQFIRAAWPELVFWFVPNGGNLSKVQRAMFQLMGLKPGVPDLHFILPHGKLGCIELKSAKGRRSETQEDFRLQCERFKVPWAEARSLEDVEAILAVWLTPWGWNAKATLK